MPTIEIRLNDDVIAVLTDSPVGDERTTQFKNEHLSSSYSERLAATSATTKIDDIGITIEVSNKSDEVIVHVHDRRYPARSYKMRDADVLSIRVIGI
jgi:hypothetical protein